MSLDWKIRLLDLILKLTTKPANRMTVEEIKELQGKNIPAIAERLLGGVQAPVFKITENAIQGRHGEVPIRTYYPIEGENLGLILFFHGGGWIAGNFQTHNLMCRQIAHDTGAIVIAVQYRLAPFYKYPTALEDCYDVLLWAEERHRERPLIVTGDSAGGNLATALCLMARDQGKAMISRQVLMYPILDGTLSQDSLHRNANAPVLTRAQMESFVQHYAQTAADVLEPCFSPLQATNLSNLPPALIVTAEYDPLHDEALAYAERLRDAGTVAIVKDYAGMIHGFLSFPPFCRSAAPAFSEIAAFIHAATV